MAESRLSGTALNDFVLSTPYYTPGQNDQFTVDLYDAQILLDAGTAATNYTLSGSAITLNNLGGIGSGALINVASGSHIISAPLILSDNASITGSGSLNFTGGVTGNYTLSIFSNVTVKSIQVDTLNIGTAGGLQAVPEPSILALLGMGAFGFIAWGWRRTRTT